jgi:hypothetical protein
MQPHLSTKSLTYSVSSLDEASLLLACEQGKQQSSKRRNHQYEQQRGGPRPVLVLVRVLFLVAVAVAIGNTLRLFLRMSSRADYPSETLFLDTVWELGWSGMQAQRLADDSLFSMQAVPMPMLGSSINSHHGMNASVVVPDGCETTVMLIRHCEKGNLRSHCNYNGYERAVYLSTLFGNEKGDRWPAPSSPIYALKKTRKHGHINLREVETVQFIGSKLDVSIDQSYSTHKTKKLSETILTSIKNGEKCGKVTLVSWKHSDLPRLAHHLGTYCIAKSMYLVRSMALTLHFHSFLIHYITNIYIYIYRLWSYERVSDGLQGQAI